MPKRHFLRGLRDGFPIGLGYFAVSFGLGISCRAANLTAFQGFLLSFLNNASAGEYGGITIIASDSGFLIMAAMMLVVNARYMLMSCALSQRLSNAQGFIHRLAMAFAVTDELFGIAISRPGVLNPYYYYGGMAVAIPGWSIGTACGIIAGAALPERIVSALSVALFGMFLAIIIPPARESRIILTVVITSFIASFAATYMEPLAQLTDGTRTIILTVVIAAAAAWFRPVQSQQKED